MHMISESRDAPVTQTCLGCICEAISGCNRTTTCAGDVCGLFRITWGLCFFIFFTLYEHEEYCINICKCKQVQHLLTINISVLLDFLGYWSDRYVFWSYFCCCCFFLIFFLFLYNILNCTWTVESRQLQENHRHLKQVIRNFFFVSYLFVYA